MSSIVQDNLMTRRDYTPYCGGEYCQLAPRTVWKDNQFECSLCGWRSSFEVEFIDAYKRKWELK